MAATELKISTIDYRRDDVAAALAAIRERLSPRGDIVSEAGRRRTLEVFGQPLTPTQVVERICTDVRSRGLPAVLEYTAKLDGKTLTAEALRVPAEELAQAHAAADPEFLETVRRVRTNIWWFQKQILHQSESVDLPGGGFLEQSYVPLSRVGLYFPGGAAAYPSTVLMTVVPAQVAGVKAIAVASPPTPLGAYHPDLLATCHELGITEVYRVGGAQAIAALAYGVSGLPRVDKIFGPGNIFVALAKKFVFGEVDIDAIAGPSEVVVVADDTAIAKHVAADLIAQAEHSPGASVLVTWSEKLLRATAEELERQLQQLSRGDLARQSLEQFGALILVRDVNEAVSVADELAPEHLHIMCDDALRVAVRIPHAGAVFLGPYTPVAVGDYVAGPSHVLPTGGTARFASGLSANSFLRSHSMIHFRREDLERTAADVRLLADKEGLTAHRASVDVRLSAD